MDRLEVLYGVGTVVAGTAGGFVAIIGASAIGLSENAASFIGIAGFAIGAGLWLLALNTAYGVSSSKGRV